MERDRIKDVAIYVSGIATGICLSVFSLYLLIKRA
jgi:hypothetical protein